MKPLRPALAVLVLSAAWCGCGPRAEEEPVWVGFVAALGGPAPSTGVRVKQGIELAVDDAGNRRVEGRRLAVVIADDRGADETTQAETVRLLSVNRVAALLGGAEPGRAAVLARTAQPYGVPVVLAGEWAGPSPGNATFSLAVRPGWRGQMLARYASGELKLKTAAVLTDGRDPVAVELAAAFIKEWPREDGASVRQETFRSDAELQEQTPRLAGTKPAVVLIAADASHFKMAHSLLQTQPSIPLLYGGHDVGAEGLSADHGEVVTATVVTGEEFTERGQAFAKQYEGQFQGPPDFAAVQGYDAARVLFDAMERAKTALGAKVRDQLAATTTFESLTGPLGFKDGWARRRLFLVRLSDGRAKVVGRIEPETDER